MKSLILFLLLISSAVAQDTHTRHMAWCAKLAEANMKATHEKSPEVEKTIESFLYEYSEKSHTCVAVLSYRVKGDQVQILARNMVTNQPMKGYDEVYLEPLSNKQGIQDAINYLFAEYSK
jgi:hypothetical protein